MIRHISYPHIEQFRNCIKDVKRNFEYVGRDENDDPIYDEALPKPVITFHGTVKLHGSLGCVCWNPIDGLWVCSRERVITPQDDNFGFARYIEEHKEAFIKLLQFNREHDEYSPKGNYTEVIFGEWAGKGINNGTGINNIPKSFFLFGSKSIANDEGISDVWTTGWFSVDKENGIHSLRGFPSYSISIDFNKPEESSEELNSLTSQVEAECPVAKRFGFEGVGEGIVWKACLDNEFYMFKVKGEKHQVTKVKNPTSINAEVAANVKEFVDNTVTEARFNQAITVVFGDSENVDIKKIGDYLKWISEDIQREESDTLKASNLEWKDVVKEINNRVKSLFMALLKS